MSFDPHNVDLDTADPTDIVCYLNSEGNEYNGQLGARISAIFVIMFISSAATFFPVVAQRVPRLRIPVYVYLFARYFGAGVIVATAFIHLLDPAYDEIGPASCVGMTGHWADYSWCPAIVLTSMMMVFLMDFGAERYVEIKYGICREDPEPIMSTGGEVRRVDSRVSGRHADDKQAKEIESQSEEVAIERSVRQQIAALLILEFGVIFHSVIIGLNLGVAGDEFATLYPVLVFHSPSRVSVLEPACPVSHSRRGAGCLGSCVPPMVSRRPFPSLLVLVSALLTTLVLTLPMLSPVCWMPSPLESWCTLVSLSCLLATSCSTLTALRTTSGWLSWSYLCSLVLVSWLCLESGLKLEWG